MGCWMQCVITQISGDGNIMIDAKPGVWITREQQATSICLSSASGGCTPQANATVAVAGSAASRRPETRPMCTPSSAQAQDVQLQPFMMELEFYSQTMSA